MPRGFHGLLFLGNGEHSVRERQRLHEILDRALDLSGGLQQPGPEDPSDERYHREIEDAVRDVAAALLGREIELGEVLAYPPAKPAARTPV